MTVPNCEKSPVEDCKAVGIQARPPPWATQEAEEAGCPRTCRPPAPPLASPGSLSKNKAMCLAAARLTAGVTAAWPPPQLLGHCPLTVIPTQPACTSVTPQQGWSSLDTGSPLARPEEGSALGCGRGRRELHSVDHLAPEHVSTAVSNVLSPARPGPTTFQPLYTVAQDEANDPDRPQTRDWGPRWVLFPCLSIVSFALNPDTS